MIQKEYRKRRISVLSNKYFMKRKSFRIDYMIVHSPKSFLNSAIFVFLFAICLKNGIMIIEKELSG